MKHVDDVLEQLRGLKPYLRERFHVAQIGVFGSVARGEATERSDIDIYIELSEPLGWDFMQLGDELEKALGMPVDVADREMLQRLWKYVEPDLVYA